jgi:ABC-type Fe3+ transport system permease subunit
LGVVVHSSNANTVSILIVIILVPTTRVALGVFWNRAAAGSHLVDSLLDEVTENSLLLGGSSGFAEADDKFRFLGIFVQVGPEIREICSRK